MSPAARAAMDVVVALGLVVLLPLGLRLLSGMRRVAALWPVVGAAGAASVWLPRGPGAVGLAVVYAAATVGLVLAGVLRATRWWRTAPAARVTGAAQEVAVTTALLTPVVGAVALVAERGGHRFLGFELDILALTVPHLHVAGFAAALVAGLVARQVGGANVPRGAARPVDRRLADVAALTVPAGTAGVLVGYFLGDWAELAGAVVLTAGMWLVAWLVVTSVDPGTDRTHGVVRPLLLVSAAVLSVSMLLALWWAVGEATGAPHPSLSWMVGTHGLANALGFGLCGLVAWNLVEKEPL